MMLAIVLSFLVLSLFLYVLLGGADFGAGILELFSSKKHQEATKKTIYRVIGPVWEANHIWIIIVIVILWVTFPHFYNILVVYLHIPLTLVLLGITLRGVAFVFRHYDAFKDRSQILYDWMFRISSLLTPIFLGMTFGAMISGKLIVAEDVSQYHFASLFIHPWLHPFSILVGFFFAALCAFLSAVLLIGEANTTKNIYVRKARTATLTVVAIGCIVLIYGFLHDITFVSVFLKNPYAIASVLLSALLIIPLLRSIKRGSKIVSRILAGLQVVLILTAALAGNYPDLMITADGTFSILQNIASRSTIRVLAISLLIGGVLILPGLFHLLKSFKMIKILEKE